MDADLKKRWVEALRSGKYEQGKGRLRDGDAFCCLGVLCDVIAADGWAYDLSFGKRHPAQSSDGDEFVSEDLLPFFDQENLASLNDQGASFASIADEIEETL